MSTIFCNYFSSYLIHTKDFKFEKDSLKIPDKPLTDPRVSKAGRPYLYSRRAYNQVFKHVFRRLYPSKPYNWCLHGLLRFPDEPLRDRFDGRPGQASRQASQPRLPRPVVDRHRGVGVCYREGIRTGSFCRAGYKSNICNQRRELHPERSLSGPSGCPNDLRDHNGVTPKLHPSFLHIGAGDVQLVPGQPIGIFQDLDDLGVVLHGVAKYIGNDRRIKFSQYREFFGHECPNPYVLEPHGIQHPRWGLTKPRPRSTFHRFAGETFGDEAAEGVQIYKVGKFEAVSEGSTGGENGIPQAQRANLHAQVNSVRGTHFAESLAHPLDQSRQKKLRNSFFE